MTSIEAHSLKKESKDELLLEQRPILALGLRIYFPYVLGRQERATVL